LPTEIAPTLRIDDIEVIPRTPEDGPVYMLDAGQQERFSQVRWKARTAESAAVGFFRSHLRPGSLKPSLADRSLLSAEFKQPVFAVLLIQGTDPHMAAFFLATNGSFSEEPAVREFRFDEKEFNALPEIPAEAPLPGPEPTANKQSKRQFYATIILLLLIGAGACALLWSLGGRSVIPGWFGSARLHLNISPRNNILRISWNHAAAELGRASGATLAIQDGLNTRDVRLGLDELRLGAVEYEKETRHVRVTMTLDTPGSSTEPESAEWEQQ
jgi:hypothetical protein